MGFSGFSEVHGKAYNARLSGKSELPAVAWNLARKNGQYPIHSSTQTPHAKQMFYIRHSSYFECELN